jgi:hypothetical protein
MICKMSCKLFWRVIRLTYPWVPLIVALWRVATSKGIQRTRAWMKVWLLYSRIDIANLLAIAIDLGQPEYWV